MMFQAYIFYGMLFYTYPIVPYALAFLHSSRRQLIRLVANYGETFAMHLNAKSTCRNAF